MTSTIEQLVSIIMPAYNAEAFIRNAINSVLNQSYNNWELILINDGSTDRSAAIAKSFTDKRILYIEQNNQGVASARNAGLDIAKGEFICFLDADDTFPEQSLEARIKVFDDPQVAFVDGQVLVFNENNSSEQHVWTPNFKGNPLSDLVALTGKSFLGITWMIRKSQIQNIRFKTGMTHAEDLLFLIEISALGGLYNYTEETILRYRKGHLSAMKNIAGLHDGYQTLYEEVKKQKLLSDAELGKMKNKLRSIVFKSFAGSGRPIQALQSLFQW